MKPDTTGMSQEVKEFIDNHYVPLTRLNVIFSAHLEPIKFPCEVCNSESCIEEKPECKGFGAFRLGVNIDGN